MADASFSKRLALSREIDMLYDIDLITAQNFRDGDSRRRERIKPYSSFTTRIFTRRKNSFLEAVQAASKRLVVVLLRDVYDVEYVKENVLCLTNYGFRVCDIEAVMKKLFSPSAVPAQ